MSEDIKYSQQHDAFDKLFRQQLHPHRLPVNDEDWAAIEQRLGKRKRSKLIWFWSVSSMAASIALLIFFGFPATDAPVSIIESHTPGYTEKETISTVSVPEVEKHNEPVPEKEVIPVLSHNSGTSSSPALLSEEKQSSSLETLIANVLPEGLTETEPESTPEISVDVVATKSENTPVPVYDLLPDEEDTESTSGRKKNKWLLAAAFGSGGGTDPGGFLQQPPRDQMYQSSSSSGLFHLHPEYTSSSGVNHPTYERMTADDFSDMNYNPPLSFGVTARKSLSDTWGIESGLVYTYLSAKYKWSGYDIHQRLHYIGIPVNMVAYLWNKHPNWKIYFSFGGMVEKGLRAIYTEERSQGGTTRTTTVKTSIDGFQWSATGALGVNYRFSNGLGIYLEPRLAYCFDNDQPVSIRSEWPLSIGVNMGMNFEF